MGCPEVSGEGKEGRRGFSLVLIHELVPRAGEGSKGEQKKLVLVLSTDGQALKEQLFQVLKARTWSWRDSSCPAMGIRLAGF